MKTMRTAMTGILLSSVLFTACSKNNDLAVTPASGTTTARTVSADEIMDVNFNEGLLITSNVRIISNGREVTELRGLRKLDLFAPVTTTYDLPLMHHKTLQVQVDAVPPDGGSSMYLRGEILMENGDVVPVVFVIDERMRLLSSSQSVQIIDATNFLDLLNINTDVLTDPIAPDMWRNAERVNEEIFISSRINPEIHRLLMENLKNMVKISFPVVPSAPTTDRHMPIDPHPMAVD